MKKHLFFLLCFLLSSFLWADKPSILIGSPIRQKPLILKEFLESLSSLETQDYEICYFFIDDNTDPSSSLLLKEFEKNQIKKCIISPPFIHTQDSYVCDEKTHHWTESLVWKVASFKNEMIKKAKEENFDYLFLIDSDIVLHPLALNQLVRANKQIVSNVFWSSWTPESALVPQVWVKDHYTQFEIDTGESISKEEAQKRFLSFLLKIRTPGTYEVGGLCACTLINKEALSKGVSFSKIANLSFWGEDRHFCVRAAALGLKLFVDTHLPCYHIY